MMRPPFVLSCKDAFFKRCQNILLDVTLGELQTLFFYWCLYFKFVFAK